MSWRFIICAALFVTCLLTANTIAAKLIVVGGVVLTALGTVIGEWKAFHPSLVGLGAIVYLMLFGSIVGYSCFLYILRHTPPTIAATYSYVTTVVAVLLGWAVLGERITGRTVIAIVAVLGSVVWVQRGGRVVRLAPLVLERDI